MFLFSPKSAYWRRLTLIAAALLLLSYGWYAATQFPHGGTPMGLAYGILGTLLMLLLLFFAARKRWHRSRLGTLEGWCQSHVYLGLLVVLVILLHSGFRFEDRVAVAALAAMTLVSLSGVVGVVLYTLVPWLLTGVENNLPPDVAGPQINQLAGAIARQASGKSATFRQLADALLAEARPGWLAGWRLLLRGGRRDEEDREAPWVGLLPSIPPAEQADLKQLLILSRQHRELHAGLLAQQRYRNLLVVWLYVHVPLSVLLVVLVVAHLGGVAYYSDALGLLGIRGQ